MKLIDNKDYKIVKSPDYNYIFRKRDGLFFRWGSDKKDDPKFAPSPEIADIEITTKCNYNCEHCYKSNTISGENMSFEIFKELFLKLPKTITQIAFGADFDLSSKTVNKIGRGRKF
jgi:sulfatase maturation enzyme AslB (radical SAM superfamily)